MRQLIVVTLMGLGVSACGAPSDREPAGSDRRGLGVIEGSVALVSGAVVPAYFGPSTTLRTLMPDSPANLPTSCPDARAPERPVGVTSDGLLAGVLVAASEFARTERHEARVHDVTIEHCRLRPSLVNATRGDELRLRNLDDFPFSPSFGPTPQAHPLSRRKPTMVALSRAGVESILCPLSAPCGRVDVVTLKHPLHVQTDATGHFRLEGFPVGERVKLSAWHPLFEEASTDVWLERGETLRVDLQLSPRAHAP